MGEARRRGSREERLIQGIHRNKANFYRDSGLINPDSDEIIALRVVLTAFLSHLRDGEWEARKAAIRDRIAPDSQSQSLADSSSVRDEQDEIAWYLYLAELAVTDPLCQETNQASRTLPFLVSIGQRWGARGRVAGLEDKVKDLLTKYRSAPDGLLFEIMVALAYATNGWNVEMLKANPPAKSPDLLVSFGQTEFYVECKRQSRRPKYAEHERQAFLNLWEGVPAIVRKSQQWVWFDIMFHEEVSKIPSDYLLKRLANGLPLAQDEITVVDDSMSTIRARLIDKLAVQRHMAYNQVKDGSATLRALLGADWAPLNSSGSLAINGRRSTVAGCENIPSSRWLDEIEWAMGCTRACDAPLAIAAKARDVKRLLVDAVRQVPSDKPSIIHIAIETLEGRNVDRLRNERIQALISTFEVDRPVQALFLHSIQCNEVVDKPWEVDETVDWYFGPKGEIPNLPKWILLPPDTVGSGAAHWDLYQ